MGELSAFKYQTIAFAALCVVTLGFLGGGCGQGASQRAPVVPVQGQISFNGAAIPGAFVVLHPQGDPTRTPPARGQVRLDGTFSVTTFDANDGAVAGEYTVTVEWRRTVRVGGDVEVGPNVLPAKYSSPKTSDLHVRVAEGGGQLPPLIIRR
jgi:hypothetical protein